MGSDAYTPADSHIDLAIILISLGFIGIPQSLTESPLNSVFRTPQLRRSPPRAHTKIRGLGAAIPQSLTQKRLADAGHHARHKNIRGFRVFAGAL